METYIALLRGINVSGKNIIKMANLQKALSNISCFEPKTYLQSGNIVFNFANSSTAELEKSISECIEKEFLLKDYQRYTQKQSWNMPLTLKMF